MKNRAIWYHAGCAVCVAAENALVAALDPERYDVEKVDLGQHRGRVAEAAANGVRTVPALVLGEEVFHINFGADLAALK